MPGITVPAASGSNDNCGYASSGFNENILLCDMTASGGGAKPAVIEVFYSDEHALTLGCDTMTNPVSMQSANPDAVYYPRTGDPACTDSSGRPLRPVLFVTDITADPNCTSGDQQNGGTAYDPVAVFGAWKSATEMGTTGTPNAADPMPINYWDLGTSADPVTANANMNCPCTSSSCNTFGLMGRGYGAEIRFEVGLVAFHSYRLQFMLHDGDQTQGADSSEGCAVYCSEQ
jgi:hypothetical protein